jgi:cystathionine beta-lyase/cystathionine gamma-synthase
MQDRKPPVTPEPVADAGFETICVHLGEERQRHYGAAAPPLYQTSTFMYPDAQAFDDRRSSTSDRFDYSRIGNPTNELLETKLARLEHGAWAGVFSSGMGAITAAMNPLLHHGAHVVALDHLYGPARMYLKHVARFGVQTTFVPSCDFDGLREALRPETRLIYLESPTSGYIEVPEIAPVVALAKQHGVRTLFDNSWASPYFQNPLDWGIDLVVHSASKYLNGHSDLVAGVVVGRDEELRRGVLRELELSGAALDPFGAWLMLRGLRTLAVRMEHAQRVGLAAAHMLAEHAAVQRVMHPGLPGHPQHAIARRQLRGTSSLLSMMLREQSREATHRFLNRLRLFGLGVSWGGHESLAIGGVHGGARKEWIIRLYLGLETIDDLLADLRQALES